MDELLSPKQVARAIGVSESSLKRWCDKGLIEMVRTAGGHRRLARNDVVQYLRRTGHPVVRPEVLGLPATVGKGETVVGRARRQARDALLEGDEDSLRRIVLDLYLAQHSARDICDRIIAPAIDAIGELWACGEAEVYQERRGCDACLHVLYELRAILRSVPDSSLVAIGGTLSGDPYQLPTMMVEIALREANWNASSLGSNLPAQTLCAAMREIQPRLFWLSCSHIADASEFQREYASLFETARAQNVAVVVGGKALTPEIRKEMRYGTFCDNLRHLVSFVATLEPTHTVREGESEPPP